MYNSHINPYRYTYTYVLTDLYYIHTCIMHIILTHIDIHICMY